MIRAMYFTSNGKSRTDVSVDDFASILGKKEGYLWVDFQDTPPETDEPILLNTFGFHPLAVDDALQETHVPKIDDWGQYLYIVLHAVCYDKIQPDRLTTIELDAFLGKNYLVTHHDVEIDAIERVWSMVQRDERQLRYGVDHLLYRIADEVVASYMPVIEEIDDAVDLVESNALTKPTPATLTHIFAVKRSILHLRRIIAPQREVLNKLARDAYPVIDARDRVYFRDVYDHLVRLHDITESLRDMMSGVLDTYLTVLNNRMNEVMKTLTVIATLFLPLSFLASFFGMNFFTTTQPQGLDSWVSEPIFYVMLLIFIFTPFTMYVWMHRRGWM
jgi:magnesium transporter